jgi:2-dehydropantoate 2-reductase
MRILVVGAGAIGGYFGGRLLEKGNDVTFLVREKRNQQISEHGLTLKSIHGDVTLHPKTIVAGEKVSPFDVVVISTKAYHLEAVISSLSDYIDKTTMILPLLNGISHVSLLKDHFGDNNVIGGLCFIETTLDDQGTILQTSQFHDLVFGELSGEKTERITRLQEAMSGTKANFRLSNNIMKELWHKYLFITTLSGVTTLMRSPIGPILVGSGGANLAKGLGIELTEIANKIEAPIAPDYQETLFSRINQMGYKMKSSMQRDMEKGLPVEADHLQGYLKQLATQNQITTPILDTVYTNLKVYELQNK